MTRCIWIKLTLIGLFIPSASWGQSVYENIKIDGGTDMFAPKEPSITMRYQDPSHLLAGAVLNNIYTSEDSGRTWRKDRLESTYGVFGDPCVVADTKDNYYVFHLSSPSGYNWKSEDILDRIVCQKSTDNGKTWNNGSYMGLHGGTKDQDKEWVAVDPQDNTLYATWTQFDKYNSKEPQDSSVIFFSKSTDEGESWTEAVRLNRIAGDCQDHDETVEGAVPAVGPNKELYVAWCHSSNIYFDRSLDGGKTWLNEDIVATTGTKGWDFKIPGIARCNGLPITKVDLSDGPNRGTIYINWTDQRNGEEDTDVWLISSKDQGNTWTSPVRVNDDESKKHQFFTWMDIDQKTGALYCVFYDRRNYEDTQTDVFLASSSNGGKTFTNERISETPFVSENGIFFGDYNNISVYNGVVRPIWTRQDGKEMSIWTAIINK